MAEHEEELDIYGDQGITSAHGRVPTWLKWCYILCILWGIAWMYLYWNGVEGWLDRGYWFELEKAANTTFPSKNLSDPQQH